MSLNNNEKKAKKNIKIIIGDDSELEISDVGDCMNDVRPKKKQEKDIVIPKIKPKK